MAKYPGLRPRGKSGIYYYRVRVPKDLVGRLGFKDHWASLKTRDFSSAKERYSLEAAKLQTMFAEHRRRRDLLGDAQTQISAEKVGVLPKETAIALARALVAERMTLSDRNQAGFQLDEDSAHQIECELGADIAALQQRGNENGDLRVSQSAGYLLRKYGVEDATASDPILLGYVRRALLLLAKEELSRLSGDFSAGSSDALFQDVSDADLIVSTRPGAPTTVKDAADMFWHAEIATEITSRKTELKYRSALGHVISFFGPDRPVHGITRSDCTEFRDLIARVPANFTKRFGKDLSLEQIAQRAAGHTYGAMAYETQATYINMMLRMLAWAVNEGHIADIRLSKIKPLAKKVRNEDKRGSFTASRLNAIFTAPLYTGCVDDKHGFARPGPNIIRRSRYWVPLVALFTGMRMGEILQLAPGHIRKSDGGTPYIVLLRDITLKTVQSRREIPVHSALVSFGFLDFVAAAEKAGKSRIFDDVPVASDGTLSSLFSKRYAYFLEKVGLEGISVGDCFHMFRHTLRDALRRGNVPEEQAEAICGWSRSGRTSRIYGDGFEAETLALWMEKLVLPRGVDLSHLGVLVEDRSAGMPAAG